MNISLSRGDLLELEGVHFRGSFLRSTFRNRYFLVYSPFPGRLAQLARAFPLHGKGHWFESSSAHYESPRLCGVFYALSPANLEQGI